MIWWLLCSCCWVAGGVVALDTGTPRHTTESSVCQEEMEALRLQLESVVRERDEAVAENVQSAKFGLGLLEETALLKKKCEELQSLYDDTRQELEVTQQALAKSQSVLKATKVAGLENEENLLSDSAELESSLTLRILELENEVTQLQQRNEQLTGERDRLVLLQGHYEQSCKERESERKAFQAALSDIKVRETLLITEYSELEEENASLQKQVSSLKYSQVEFEGAKHEIRRLQEEVEVMNEQVEELAILKKVAEKQMEEALESLQLQRESNYALRQALNERIDDEEHIYSMNHMVSIRKDDAETSIDEELLPITSQLQGEVTALKSKLEDAEQRAAEVTLLKNKAEKRVAELDCDVQLLRNVAKEAKDLLCSTQNKLQAACDEVAKLYYFICSINEETPSPIFTEYGKESEVELGPVVKLTGGHLSAIESVGGISGLSEKAETVLQQIKFVRSSFRKTNEQCKARGGNMHSTNGIMDAEACELQEQVNELKYLLSIKQEHITSYRSVLKANQNVVENALNTLKSKYEKEKTIARDTMIKLRNELRLLREDAATFSSLRSMFGARCEEYALEVDEWKRKFIAADRERNIIGQLLSIAVRQRLDLSKKLE